MRSIPIDSRKAAVAFSASNEALSVICRMVVRFPVNTFARYFRKGIPSAFASGGSTSPSFASVRPMMDAGTGTRL